MVVLIFNDYADKNALYYMLLYSSLRYSTEFDLKEPKFYHLSSNGQLSTIPLDTEGIYTNNTLDINELIPFINNTESIRHLILNAPTTKLSIHDCNHITYLQIVFEPSFTQRVFYYMPDSLSQIESCHVVNCPSLEYLFISSKAIENCNSLKMECLQSLRYLHIDGYNCTEVAFLSITSRVSSFS